MGDYNIRPTNFQGTTLDIDVQGEFLPSEAIELGVAIINAARDQASRNGTPKLTFVAPRGAGA